MLAETLTTGRETESVIEIQGIDKLFGERMRIPLFLMLSQGNQSQGH